MTTHLRLPLPRPLQDLIHPPPTPPTRNGANGPRGNVRRSVGIAIPMNRLGSAEECVGTFVYLASDEMSGYVTGQIIEVNGGQYMP